jgi:hypothetical protein
VLERNRDPRAFVTYRVQHFRLQCTEISVGSPTPPPAIVPTLHTERRRDRFREDTLEAEVLVRLGRTRRASDVHNLVHVLPIDSG